MGKIPISIVRILEQSKYRDDHDEESFNERFLIQMNEKHMKKWELINVATREELIKFRNSINGILGYDKVQKKLDCSIEQVEEIVNYQLKEEVCKGCEFKNMGCFDCIFTCQSPLEQKLFLTFEKRKIESKLQWRINKDGHGYSKEIPVDRSRILTIPDFYIENNGKKICIYADGHTYHERTENQALRDRKIDRELQNLGYTVLRFTGKEIRENIGVVINTIVKNSDLTPRA